MVDSSRKTIQNRVVVLTGCSTGIGRAAAGLLLERGHTVYVTARRAESLGELGPAMERFNGRAVVRRLDLTDFESCSAVVSEAAETHGRVDALVNNAGYGQIGAVEDLTADGLRRQFEVNVVGTVELIRLALPWLRRSDSGRVVNVSSVVAHVPMPLMGAYDASKAALDALSVALRLEVAGTNVHVALVEPGAIETAFRETSVGLLEELQARRDSPYRNMYRAWLKRWQRTMGRGAAPPELVARVISRAVESRRPKTRYRVTPVARIAPFVYPWLPDRLADWMIRRLFGLGRE